MKREITIALQYDLAIGKVNLNEIAYRLKELKDPLMLWILKEILKSHDGLISKRLNKTKIIPVKARKGLGQHIGRDDLRPYFGPGSKLLLTILFSLW